MGEQKGKKATPKAKTSALPPKGKHMMPGSKMPMKDSDMTPMQDRELKNRYPSMFQKSAGKKR